MVKLQLLKFSLQLHRAFKVHQQPLSGRTSKITNHCSPLFCHSSFSPAFGTNSHTLFNPTFPSRSSKQMFTIISHLPSSITMIFSTPINPHPSYSLLSFHLVFPMFPTPSHSLPQISSCVYSPLFSASLSHPSCLLVTPSVCLLSCELCHCIDFQIK